MLYRTLITDKMADAHLLRQSIRDEVEDAVWSIWHSGASERMARLRCRLAALRAHARLRLTCDSDVCADYVFEQVRDEYQDRYDRQFELMRRAASRVLEEGGDPGDAAEGAAKAIESERARPPAYLLDQAMIAAINQFTWERRPKRRSRVR